MMMGTSIETIWSKRSPKVLEWKMKMVKPLSILHRYNKQVMLVCTFVFPHEDVHMMAIIELIEFRSW